MHEDLYVCWSGLHGWFADSSPEGLDPDDAEDPERLSTGLLVMSPRLDTGRLQADGTEEA